jgi:hypothetical protein
LDNTVKLLIFVIMIFAVIGFIFNSNNTLVKYPSLTTTNQISNNSNNISPNEAISIANSNIPAFGEVRYGVTLIPEGQNPYYLVTLY